MRFRDDLLAATQSMAAPWCMAAAAQNALGEAARSRPAGLLPRRCRQLFDSRRGRGEKTGPNPTDRRRAGSKHHIITDAQGIPLNVILTPANDHDVTQLIPLVDGIPPIAGKPGRPKRKPDRLQADRAYDSNPHRAALRQRRIIPVIARRRTQHGSGLGVTRWVVERTHAWLHQFRRLRIRFERRSDIHEAFLKLGCCLICWRCLKST
jgi:transposase